MRAERRLGELITLQKETVGLNQGGWTGNQHTGPINANSGGVPSENTPRTTPTLESVGINRKLSSHAQKVASIPEPG